MRRELIGFFMLACGITWLVDVPFVLSTLGSASPSPTAMALAGLGAWGPTLAALAIAARKRALREVFGRWRTKPIWIAVGLALMPTLHFAATLIEFALGGHPAAWWYPPTRPEQVAALVMFSLGEEFGWRGFAYPRAEKLYGALVGSLILGCVWAIWHLGMWFTPHGPPSLSALGLGVLELSLASVVVAWIFEKGNRSMAVAIACHASAHLDNTSRAPESEVRLRALRLVVLALGAAIAARALRARTAKPSTERSLS